MRASLPRLRGALLAASLLLIPASAAAQNSEQRAQDLMADAMDQDYLATNFKAAEAKLQTALRVCSEGKCSDDVLARVYRNLGVVYAGGMQDKEKGVEAFKEMLRRVPGMTLDKAFVSDAVQAAYDEAKEGAAPTPVVVDKAIAVLKEEPWSEQVVGTPIPVYVEIPEDVAATKVIARYRQPGSKEWREVALQKHGNGFGGYIPCGAVLKAGTLLYFTTAFDENLDRVASGGSASEPRKVLLKEAISGRQPTLPDSTPPSRCPGAGAAEDEGLSCETSDDCPGAQVCRDLYCVPEEDVPETPEEASKKNWLQLSFSGDLQLLQESNDACSANAQKDGTQACFFGDGTQFTGQLEDGAGGNTVAGGFAPGTLRVLVGYDRVVAHRMTIGARLGFAFLGHPEFKEPEAKSFFPVHAEARFAFHIADRPFETKGVRPFLFLGGGLGDVAAKVTTDVVEDRGGPTEDAGFQLDVYQRGGPFFAGGGVGLQYAPEADYAMNIELGVKQMFPDAATVIVPSLGFALGL